MGAVWLDIGLFVELQAKSRVRQNDVLIMVLRDKTIRLIVKRLAIGALGNYAY